MQKLKVSKKNENMLLTQPNLIPAVPLSCAEALPANVWIAECATSGIQVDMEQRLYLDYGPLND